MRDKRLEEINIDWKLIGILLLSFNLKLPYYRTKVTIIILTKTYVELCGVTKMLEYWNQRRKRAYGRKLEEKEKDRKQKDKEFFLRFANDRNNKSRLNVRICTNNTHIRKRQMPAISRWYNWTVFIDEERIRKGSNSKGFSYLYINSLLIVFKRGIVREHRRNCRSARIYISTSMIISACFRINKRLL